MAYYAPVNGDAQPVFALDVQNGPVAASTSLAGQPVQPQGPKLDFFRAVANASINGEGGVQEYVANVLQAIQQTTTVAMYQVTPTAPAVLNIAVYPVGAANTATIVAAAQTANATGGLNIGIPTANVAGAATFTNV